MEIKRERQRIYVTEHSRCFEYAPHCGFGFPCDEHGNVFDLNEAAMENYRACLAGEHPKLKDIGIRKSSRSYVENAIGICDSCKSEVELHDEYCGACQCPECGAWYNLSGQNINPPAMWEEPIEPADYY